MHFFLFLTISIQQNPINMIIRNNIIINKFLNVYKRIMGNPDEHHGLRYLGYCDLIKKPMTISMNYYQQVAPS